MPSINAAPEIRFGISVHGLGLARLYRWATIMTIPSMTIRQRMPSNSRPDNSRASIDLGGSGKAYQVADIFQRDP